MKPETHIRCDWYDPYETWIIRIKIDGKPWSEICRHKGAEDALQAVRDAQSWWMLKGHDVIVTYKGKKPA